MKHPALPSMDANILNLLSNLEDDGSGTDVGGGEEMHVELEDKGGSTAVGGV